jgi:endonuclease G
MSSRVAEKLLRAALRSRMTGLALFAAGVVSGAFLHSLDTNKPATKPKHKPAQPSTAQPQAATAATVASLDSLDTYAPATFHYRRKSDHFLAEFDAVTRSPKFVLEYLNKDNTKKVVSRANHQFKEDTGIPASLRARLEDYEGSGYDRGHMAPAADHSADENALADTFYLSNISPQVGVGFNRDYWARLESMVRHLVHDFDHVYVVTGPLFLPKHVENNTAKDLQLTAHQSNATPPPTVGSRPWKFEFEGIGKGFHWIPVPTHFYKVICVMQEGSTEPLALAAFLLPNEVIAADTPLLSFAVPLSSLEYASGMSFFPSLAPETKASADASFDVHIAPTGASLPIYSNYSAVLGFQSNNEVPKYLDTTKPLRSHHLCHVHDCTLPAANWFQKADASPKEGGSANNTSVSSAVAPTSLDAAITQLGKQLADSKQ